MYEAFFGLRERPFALTPDPAFLYVSVAHRHALALLEYAIAHGTGFALVTGEVGSGKTTLVRRAVSGAGEEVTVALLTNVHRGGGALLPWVAQSLGLALPHHTPADDYAQFEQFMLREYAAGRRVVLVVDEAQNLTVRALEELRVLSNINSGKDFLLQTILVGQPELRATLRRPGLRQFAQRIAIDYHLGPLDLADTRAYVSHRLEAAGARQELFEGAAVDLLFARTGGVPRLINVVCDMALVYAFAEQSAAVDAALMAAVIQDRATGGVLPLSDAGGSEEARALAV